jgi:hypothetical protein
MVEFYCRRLPDGASFAPRDDASTARARRDHRMSVDTVRQWVKTNDYFTPAFGGSRDVQGTDVFVPTAHKYPHIHIGANYITYSKTPSNHVYLVETGGVVRMNRIDNALTEQGAGDMNQLLRHMKSQL